MGKYTAAALFFGLIAVVTVIGVAVMSRSATSPIGAYAQNEQRAARDQGEPEKKQKRIKARFITQFVNWVERRERFINAVGVAFIAAFTVLLALSTAMLWHATRALVRDAKDTAERQLRAYVGDYKADMKIVTFEAGGFGVRAHLELRNFGQTPAYDFTIWSRTQVDEENAIPFGQGLQEGVALQKTVAFPDAGLHVNQIFAVTDEDLAAIRNGTKKVFLWGEAKYVDAFKRNRQFDFRIWNTNRNYDHPGEVWDMGAHPSGYQAT
jgi:hypothetical protein